ncbi:MAG TPA: DinB family protein [Terriglobales bacterium]|nr:DinB family protein [Terriglobales bacterium]
MPMDYVFVAIPDSRIPPAAARVFQHLLDTYASETNKLVSVWRCFTDADLAWRPHPRSQSVVEVFKHQLLSERRFFGEFLSAPEPAAAEVLPPAATVADLTRRMGELAEPRLKFLADKDETWWLAAVPFFDVERQRIWIFWRRVLHTCHHRTQLSVYLRLLNRAVPSTYGPTADVNWKGADPTQTVAAAERK